MSYRKKLIEEALALTLEAINQAAAREKSIRHGHPSTLHLWWARRPLAAARAVLFASLVDDPGNDLPEEEAKKERQRLFKLIEQLVQWENSNDETILAKAREEILRSTGGDPPAILDPFCGGGTIPLEAQRLGLKAYGSDLNPVAVLITKALVEIPYRFAQKPPVNPETRKKLNLGGTWRRAAGLAEDVRYYGRWMREEAYRRIGHLYPQVKLPKEQGGGEATVIAWLWARTVASPNPACNGVHVPLVRSFWLSSKRGKEKVWVEPAIDKTQNSYHFEVRSGDPPRNIEKSISAGTKLGRGAKFRCLLSNQPIPEDYIKNEAKAGRMKVRLMTVVAEGQKGRAYLPPIQDEETWVTAKATLVPDQELADDPRNIWCVGYGLDTFDKLFTPRQLVALTTFSDLVGEAREKVLADAVAAGLPDDGRGLEEGGTGATAYADAVATYLAMAVDRLADRSSTICSWDTGYTKIRNTFARQAIPMTWDFAEGNPFSDSTGNFLGAIAWVAEVVANAPCSAPGFATQLDATQALVQDGLCISTDPPYYDNIGYADLSDFFYVWLRRSLGKVYPQLFSTMLVPKAQELVATPYRFAGGKEEAQEHFQRGLQQTFRLMRERMNPNYPLTVYYAFKQAENEGDSETEEVVVASTGWETMLHGLVQSGFQVVGTWPMRTELTNRPVASGTNALASSIVLVCRPRPKNAPLTTSRDFLVELRGSLPRALTSLQQSNIAPVDLAQAIIGPGMAVFSKYAKVLETDGTLMTVRKALQLINQVLDEILAQQEGDLDPDTRWALAWFEQYGMEEGPFGDAETLSKAKNTSVSGLVEAGLLSARGGKVKLLRREELPEDWNPQKDKRLTIWKAAQHLIRTLEKKGEAPTVELLLSLGGVAEEARALAYRLYTICERRGWAQEAWGYNQLVVAWPRLKELAGSRVTQQQGTLVWGE